jgi:hypothetical protein
MTNKQRKNLDTALELVQKAIEKVEEAEDIDPTALSYLEMSEISIREAIIHYTITKAGEI